MVAAMELATEVEIWDQAWEMVEREHRQAQVGGRSLQLVPAPRRLPRVLVLISLQEQSKLALLQVW